MKLLIVNNLLSGYGEGSVYDFIRSFAKDGDEISIRNTDGSTEIEDLLSDASSFDAVIASGGDGTVASVCFALRETGIPILPFPAGTANLLTLNLASPSEPHALSKMVRANPLKTLDFDLGELEAQGQRFGFVVIAGAGYDAAIMEAAKPNKRLFGPLAYFSAAVSNVMPTFSKISLVIDGERIESEGLGVLLVNFSKIQFDISLTHENKPRDGELAIVILKAANAFELIPAAVAGILDRGGDYPDRGDALEIHYGKTVEVTADPPLEVQYDGETTGLTTPFSARVLKHAVRLIVSDEGYDLFVDEERDPA